MVFATNYGLYILKDTAKSLCEKCDRHDKHCFGAPDPKRITKLPYTMIHGVVTFPHMKHLVLLQLDDSLNRK